MEITLDQIKEKAVNEEGNPEYKGIDQSKIVPLLVSSFQELKADVGHLKKEIRVLKMGGSNHWFNDEK